MEDLVKLKKAMSLIIVGLYEKERQKKEGEYCYSPKLMHGINIFQSLNYKYNPKGFDFSKMHEQGFITNYAMKPIAQWFEGWENIEKFDLENQEFYGMNAVVGDSGFHTFHFNDVWEDYLEHVEKDITAGIEQRAVYDCLRLLNQEEYVNLRKYFIDFPIIDVKALRELKRKYFENDAALHAIEIAYEEIMEDCFVCPECGWTLQKEKIGMRCQSRFCVEKKYIQGELKRISGQSGMLRLKRGVMKYISVPGKLELEIYNFCNKYNVESVLWPEMDKYDIGITFPNGDTWAIDAKAVREPEVLKASIIRDGGFPQGDYKRGFYVIPDVYVNDRKDYLDIINQQLKRMEHKNVYCIKLHDLKREIRERGKQT